MTTLGVKVDKKLINVQGESVEVFLWDVAGEVSQDKVPVSYFLGAHGIIYVFDLTRPLTYQNLESDISYLKRLAPKAVIKVVANKKDLVSQEQIAQISSTLDVPFDISTSARTGENVEDLFNSLANELLQKFIIFQLGRNVITVSLAQMSQNQWWLQIYPLHHLPQLQFLTQMCHVILAHQLLVALCYLLFQ